MTKALILIACYLLGSVPFGYVLGRSKGVDLRKEGSGNIGATNALRVMGYKAGLVVLSLDALKGVAAAHLGGFTGMPDAWGGPVAGLLAFTGHCFPVFLGFRGGKGVATALGVILYLMPAYAVLALAIYAGTVLVSKYSSLGTLVSLAVVLVSVLVRSPALSYKVVTVLMAIIIVLKHQQNIRRLIARRELPVVRKGLKTEGGQRGGGSL